MKTILLLLITLACVTSLPAQSPSPAPTPACQAAEFRQFDFWLGKWKVLDPKGNQAGTSEITRQAEGCAVREQWTGASGKGGMSLNYYDPDEGKWHQDWVGADGTILHLQGGLEGKAMVLSSSVKTTKGTLMNRITWTPVADGKVTQEWATSQDGGKTWQIGFLGTYEKQS